MYLCGIEGDNMDRVLVNIGGVELKLGTDVIYESFYDGPRLHILTETGWEKLVEELKPEIHTSKWSQRSNKVQFDYGIYTVYKYKFKEVI